MIGATTVFRPTAYRPTASRPTASRPTTSSPTANRVGRSDEPDMTKEPSDVL
jgi:hypothetical protein